MPSLAGSGVFIGGGTKFCRIFCPTGAGLDTPAYASCFINIRGYMNMQISPCLHSITPAMST